MSAAGGYGAALNGALKDLNAFWERTRGSWNDSARDRFEAEVLRELAEAVRLASNSMEQIEVLLNQVKKECS